MNAFGLPLLSLCLFAGTCAAAQDPAASTSTSAPASDSSRCGRISIFDVAPRSQEL